jgi:hypothetical protein
MTLVHSVVTVVRRVRDACMMAGLINQFSVVVIDVTKKQ